MALVESHPLAFQMEEFLYNLRDHILGLNLGRWDYMASLIHFNLDDPEWVLPDRNTIPHNVPFFQNLRELMPEICHKRGMLAIGGMTALLSQPRRRELNARALAGAREGQEERGGLPDGRRLDRASRSERDRGRPVSLSQPVAGAEGAGGALSQPAAGTEGVGQRTLAGTRAAVRTVIRYRNGVLNGKGASLLDGYMEDLATDRIYRLMIAQRMRHNGHVPVADEADKVVVHTPELVTRLFDEELEKLVANPGRDLGTAETFREARRISEAMILNGEFDPV